MTTGIKITDLTNIGANLAYNSVLPIVNINGIPATNKGNVQLLGNYILSGAGGSHFGAAAKANVALTVANAAQPNITSVGTLSTLAVAGNITAGNVDGGNIITANFYYGDGGFLSNISSSGNVSIATNSTPGIMALGNGFVLNGSNQVSTSNLYNTNLTQPTQHYTLNLDTNGIVHLPDQSIINGSTLRGVPGTGDLNYTGITIGPDSGNPENTWMWVDASNAYIATDYANTTHTWTFAGDGSMTAPGNADFNGNIVTVGPGASELAGVLSNPTLVISDTGDAYIQAAINNVSDIGSADWAAYGHHGNTDGGWVDMGFTSAAFNDPAYTITGAGDGYVITQAYPVGQAPAIGGGNLILATGAEGTTKDIIFGTGGFAAANIFGRISDSNNSLELDRINSTIKFNGGTVVGEIEGPNTFGFYNATDNTAFLIELGSANSAWSFYGADGSMGFPYKPTNQRTGDAHALMFEKNNTQKVIGTQSGNVTFPIVERLVVAGGDGFDTGEGGDLYLWAGQSGANGGSGGDVKVDGGQGLAGSGGGTVKVRGGYSVNGQGGFVEVAAGGGNIGGQVNIIGGYGNSAANSGNVTVTTAYGGTWTFGTDGDLTLPSGGSIYSQSAPISGNTIVLQPAGAGVTTNQKLLVYPTAGDGDHIHLATGNLYQTELFLGTDDFYVKLANTGNAVIHTNDSLGNTATWTFGSNGNLALPQGGTITNNIPLATFDILYQYDNLVWSGNTLTFTNASSGYMLQVLALMQVGDAIILGSTPTTVTGVYTGGGAGTFTVSGTGVGQQIAQFTLPNRLTSVNGIKLTTNSQNYLFTEAGVTQSPVLTVDTLPSGVYAIAGFRAFVSDANLAPVGNFGAIVGNSGSNTVCVWCDGTNWRIG